MKISPDIFQMIGGLPGEELMAPGLRDLERGEYFTMEALLIFIARTRLTQAGFSFLREIESREVPENPESLLYQLLHERDEETAYGRYNSLKRRLDRFIRGLELRAMPPAPPVGSWPAQ